MAYPSVESPEFQQTCSQWLEKQREVLALFRYSGAAGSRAYEFFTTNTDLQARIKQLLPSTCVTVWEEYVMPLRGEVDEAFASRALEQVPDGTEWLLIRLEGMTAGIASWFHHSSGTSLTELAEELSDCAGKRIALGIHPFWLEEGGKEISAVVPDADGNAITGIY